MSIGMHHEACKYQRQSTQPHTLTTTCNSNKQANKQYTIHNTTTHTHTRDTTTTTTQPTHPRDRLFAARTMCTLSTAPNSLNAPVREASSVSYDRLPTNRRPTGFSSAAEPAPVSTGVSAIGAAVAMMNVGRLGFGKQTKNALVWGLCFVFCCYGKEASKLGAKQGKGRRARTGGRAGGGSLRKSRNLCVCDGEKV